MCWLKLPPTGRFQVLKRKFVKFRHPNPYGGLKRPGYLETAPNRSLFSMAFRYANRSKSLPSKHQLVISSTHQLSKSAICIYRFVISDISYISPSDFEEFFLLYELSLSLTGNTSHNIYFSQRKHLYPGHGDRAGYAAAASGSILRPGNDKTVGMMNCHHSRWGPLAVG